MALSKSGKNPTSRLATPGVGGVRPEPGVEWGALPPAGARAAADPARRSPAGLRSQSGRPAGPSFLDLTENNCNSFCGKWSVLGEVEDNGGRLGHVGRLGCKRWSCPRCGPKRAKQLRRAIIDQATAFKLQRLLTLTLDPRACTAEESPHYIRAVWAKQRTYLKRRYGGAIIFITVTELQKSGYAHLHVLVDRYIPQRWIQESWSALGGGRFVNIKFVDVHRISAYLSKYLTKDLFLRQFPPGTRRFTSSRGIQLFVKPIKGAWRLVRSRIERVRERFSGIVRRELMTETGVLEWFRFEVA